MDEQSKIQMRKRNMKLYPICKKLGWDFIFFYTINFLFLTQIKQISAADIVLVDAFYALYGIITQIPVDFIIQFLGRKNSIILGNILNCIYIAIIICSRGIFDLFIAEFVCSLAFAIKGSAEPGMLNASIPPTKNRSKIFAKISQKGNAGYYMINAVSTILAGFLYTVNPYIPITLCLLVLITVSILSTFYIEPLERRKKQKTKIGSPLKDMKESMHFILKTERVKALILISAILSGLFAILSNYQISLLEDLEISSEYLGILFALLGVISGIATKKQDQFHHKFKNTSLKKIGFSITFSCIVAGVAGVMSYDLKAMIGLIILSYVMIYISYGIYYALIDKYLSNFTNSDIDTKIFTATNLCKSITSAITGVGASFLLNRMETAYCMIIVGSIFTVLMILASHYMKTRLGLLPEQYSKEELKYDSLKEIERV